MQSMLMHTEENLGPLKDLRGSILGKKKLANIPPPPKKKKTVEKYAKKKMNIAAGKYPQTNTVRICMKVFFLSK